MNVYFNLLKMVTQETSTRKFAVGLILSLAFSMTVILATIGLMDGFDESLKLGLKKATGDVTLFNRFGYFSVGETQRQIFAASPFPVYSPYIQTEAFLISQEQSHGVLVRGIEPKAFAQVVEMPIPPLSPGHILLGQVLMRELNLEQGQRVVLALGRGNTTLQELPNLVAAQVGGTLSHGIYEKDRRIVYLALPWLQELLGAGDQVNAVAMRSEHHLHQVGSKQFIDFIRQGIGEFPKLLAAGFVVRPFWSEFSHLIEAVQAEKKTIVFILQIIVIVTLFNFIAFLIYIHEKKSRDIFLFHALGGSYRMIGRVWILLLIALWGGSAVLAWVLTLVVDWGLQNLSFFKLPGEIYNVVGLHLSLQGGDYLLIFTCALVYLLLIALVGMRRLARRSPIENLRQEFQ